MAPTSSGSDTLRSSVGADATVPASDGSANSPHPGWLVRIAARTGYQPSTVKELLFRKDHNWFHFVAIAVEEMLAAGKEQLVDRRLLELDLVRAGIDPSTAEHKVAAIQAVRSDASDNVAMAEYLADPRPETFTNAERHALDEVRSKIRFVRSGRRRFTESDQ